jgi:hypothetical protein
MAITRITRYGVNGDPLPEGKLDLPEVLAKPTAEEWAWARSFIGRRRWEVATTYRERPPHEYTVRDWERGEAATAEFVRFAELIRQCGFADFYEKVRNIYWAVDGLKYWTAGWPLSDTTVINRARVNAPEPWTAVNRKTA